MEINKKIKFDDFVGGFVSIGNNGRLGTLARIALKRGKWEIAFSIENQQVLNQRGNIE